MRGTLTLPARVFCCFPACVPPASAPHFISNPRSRCYSLPALKFKDLVRFICVAVNAALKVFMSQCSS